MLLRKLRSVALMGESNKDQTYHHLINFQEDTNKDKPPLSVNYLKHSFHSLLFISIWCLFLFLFFWSTSSATIKLEEKFSQKCDGSVSVYVYELPEKFNLGMLRDCNHLNVYTDMCPHVANRGLGQPITGPPPSSSSSSSWFATHQFIAEMIFHARVENHPCRTLEPRDANLFYVPFYGGLHASSKFREADLVERDRLAMELVEYLIQQPWWQRKQGRDHFLALGRTAWDFMRGEVDFGANSLLNLPEVKNMSVLTVERHPWEGHNQHGIPYPSYLHPSTSDELVMWQEKMKHLERPYLFSFVGAPRTGVQKAAIRDEILSQCSKEHSSCHLLKCGRVGASKCHNPSEVLKVMTKSQFCLQAPGDSFTRRSTFDSILAGCIPVFFSPHTAYTQYAWYLPKETSEYSVYIPIPEEVKMENNVVVDIEKELKKIPKEKVERMRNTVIGLIPRLTYMHPNSTTTSTSSSSSSTYLKDAVDVALEKLSNYVVNLTSSSLLPLPTISTSS